MSNAIETVSTILKDPTLKVVGSGEISCDSCGEKLLQYVLIRETSKINNITINCWRCKRQTFTRTLIGDLACKGFGKTELDECDWDGENNYVYDTKELKQ